MVHDSVGKYVLPSNHSILVLSDRCQLGCHEESWVFVCGRDSRRHHVLRWSSLIGLRSAARLKTHQRRSPHGTVGISVLDVSEDRRVLIYERR